MIDIHCHILPGLDDGAADEEQALEMARLAVADGIKGIIATPHRITGLYFSDPVAVADKLEQLKERLAEEEIPLALYPGSEVALEPDLDEKYANNELLTLAANGCHLLVELPHEEIPSYAEDVLYRLQLKGATPILAHPERNNRLLQSPQWIGEMVERGILIQISAPSITGLYGKRVQKIAEMLLRRGWVHFIASDAHTAGRRSPRLSPAREAVKKILSPQALSWLFEANPHLLLQGGEIKPFEAESWLKKKKASRLKNLFLK